MTPALAVVPNKAVKNEIVQSENQTGAFDLEKTVDDVVAAIKRGDQTSESGDVCPFVALYASKSVCAGTAEMLTKPPYIEFEVFGGMPTRPRRTVALAKLVPMRHREEFKKRLRERLTVLLGVPDGYDMLGGTSSLLSIDICDFVTDWNKAQIAKAQAEFDSMVEELKTVAFRGQESIKHAVAIVGRFQEKYGKSKAELTRLANACRVNVSTLYAWKRQVEQPKQKTKKPTQKKTPEQIVSLVTRLVGTDEETLRTVIELLTKNLKRRSSYSAVLA